MNAVLGARIRNLREAKGLTQEQVAEQMHCTRQRYARIEKGLTDISYASINIIAQVLGVNVEEITSAVNPVSSGQPLFRANNQTIQEDKFEFITNMIDTFYAHRKLYNSIRQVEASE